MNNFLWHLNYKIDKEYWRNIFYDNIQDGQWHWCVPKRKELFWYQLFIRDYSPLKKRRPVRTFFFYSISLFCWFILLYPPSF